MSVLSLSFFIFVLVVWCGARAARSAQARQSVLLAASVLFYASWGLRFLAVLVLSTLMNYLFLAALRRRPTATRLWIGLAGNVLLLAVFKYLTPLSADWTSAGWGAKTLLRYGMPVGISFWTFQALSALLDTYKGEELDPSWAEFALYLTFWPTVLSGPVCRLPEMLPQFRSSMHPRSEDIGEGARRIIIGLFMKLFLARVLAEGLVAGQGLNVGYDQLTQGWGGLDVCTLAVAYSFQLFFDFAGYSHIVIGVARLFGLRIPENFHDPYLSTTPSVFWTRWHMSLSFWIRDYVFLPLAILRRENWWRHLAVVVSMVIFGLWHGAQWGFLCWGVYQGLLLVAHRQWQAVWKRLLPSGGGPVATLAGWAVTFGAVSLGWILFRCHTLRQALVMYRAVLTPAGYLHFSLDPGVYVHAFVIALGYFSFCGLRTLYRRLAERPGFRQLAWALSPACYALLVTVIIIWSSQKTVFVYFKF